jgi:hypothetical protein
MGMDVFGVEPKNEKGAYFRNNVWWWRPLWEYCESVAPELTELVEFAYSNDGDGLDGDDSILLAKALRKSLRDGTADKYIADREAELEALPIRPCAHCQATGQRTWHINPKATGSEATQLPAYQYNVLEMLVDEDRLPTYTKLELAEGWVEEVKECNACNGSGGQQSFAKDYHLDKDNIRQFVTFLANCGGFQIC